MTKSLLILFICCIFSFTLLYQADAGPDDPVNIPDTVLRAAIEDRLGKTAGATITESELNNLTGTLNARSTSDGRVMQLTGLEHATSVTQMTLQNARITDLSPLTGLTQLQYLDVRNNGTIVNLSPLSGLTGLQKLYLLRNKKIVDISPLAGLTTLTVLDLRDNQITDISSLKNLTNLTELHLSTNRELSDISILKGLTKLEILGIYYTKITEDGLSAVLPSFSALSWLDIAVTNIIDLSVLGNLPSTVILDLLDLRVMGPYATRGWHLKDISPLVSLMNEGRVVSSETGVLYLLHNFRLDYESLYTYIPALIAQLASNLVYSTDVTPTLKRVSAENHVGRPGTAHTFVVQASNTTVHPPGSTDADDIKLNDRFEKVPVTFTVTAPDGTIETHPTLLTGADGLASVPITLGNDGETHIAEAVVPAKQNTDGPSHGELRVRFTATADGSIRLPQPDSTTRDRLRVTFEDYPEEKPTDEFTLTLKFSEPVIGFEKNDISVETELTRGKGSATLMELTPTTGHPDIGDLTSDPAPLRAMITLPEAEQTCTATVELPARAAGTVRLIVRADAAITHSELIGPEAATPSEPIEFGRRGPRVFPSSVAMDRIIFNEFRNAPDDTNDWIELKNISDEPVSLKDWEVSLVVPHAVSPAAPLTDIYAMDKDTVAFPEWTLPPGEILLIMNTDPSENDLLRGQNIEQPGQPSKRRPFYLRAPEMQIPNGPYLLILRSARDKNGIPAAFEDLLGEYHKGDVSYRTQIWPLRDTAVYLGTAVDLSEGEVYERRMAPRVTGLYLRARLQPEKRGYLRGAWVLSETQSGLGYRPGAPIATSLGTPGYPNVGGILETGSGTLSISEVMFATNEKGSPSQWIELYNNSTTEVVDIEGWTLKIEVRDSQPVHRHITFPLKSFAVMPNQTGLLVSRKDRTSGNIPTRRIYEVPRRVHKGWLLRAEGFALRLFSPDGTLVDMAGNLDGRMGRDKPRWELPSGWMEDGSRTSLIRRYEDGVPLRGTGPGGWVRAGETALIGAWTYYGLPTDNGMPGYRQGSPLPVTLSSFRAERVEGSVVVKWTTASEMENAGFYVLRSRENGSGFVQVNPVLILGAGTTAEGQTYTYRDTTAVANVPYDYRLEEVSLSGERRAVATVRLRGHVSAANKRLQKWADVKAEDYR